MGYRIFYSYQSDIHSDLNKKFIEDAINKAINEISEFDIEKLVIGFYGKGGNPPLAQAMLDQSESTDIFIGDVTFTSSKIWNSTTTRIEEDENIYLIEIEKPVNLKPAPNPNVLIETGYSWALKGYERSILVMNKAFGNPKELPVDMEGLRRPITYNLSQDRFNKVSKQKKEKAKLVKALKVAIEVAINSSIEYQKEKFKPLVMFSDWEMDHRYPFIKTPLLLNKIKEFKNILHLNTIRVCGIAGSGKTRFVFEVINQNKLLKEQIVYHDYNSVLAGDISKQLADLKGLNQFKIFIADNCSLDDHLKLSRHFKNSNVKLISINTVENLNENDGATMVIEENITFEIFEILINTRYPSAPLQEVISQFENNLEKFISLIEAGMKEDDFNKNSIELLTVLLEDKNIQLVAMKLLTVISLFDKIAISGDYKSKYGFIRELFLGCSEGELESLYRVLISKNLIKSKGDYVMLNGFKNDLIDHWKSQPLENINEIVLNVSKNDLWHNFADKFFDVLKNDESGDYLDSLNSKEGVLKDSSFINTNDGGQFVNLLADYFPSVAQEAIKSKIERL